MRVVVGDLYTENIEKLDLIRGKLSDLTKRNFIEMEDELYKATPLFKKIVTSLLTPQKLLFPDCVNMKKLKTPVTGVGLSQLP